MKHNMSNINVTVFIDSPHVKSFLFECSKYLASQGNRVCYISKNEQQDLPPCLQRASTTSDPYTEFMNITFVTAPHIESLMEFLLNLSKFPQIPKVLVIEDVTSYGTPSNSSKHSFLLLCSLLKHIAQVCCKFHESTVFLILSMKFNSDELNVVNFILNPAKIWKTVEAPDSESNLNHFKLQEISNNPLSNTNQTIQFSFIEKNDEQYLRVNNIKHLFEDSCNFNNKVF